jgi:hypothetical protein
MPQDEAEHTTISQILIHFKGLTLATQHPETLFLLVEYRLSRYFPAAATPPSHIQHLNLPLIPYQCTLFLQ